MRFTVLSLSLVAFVAVPTGAYDLHKEANRKQITFYSKHDLSKAHEKEAISDSEYKTILKHVENHLLLPSPSFWWLPIEFANSILHAQIYATVLSNAFAMPSSALGKFLARKTLQMPNGRAELLATFSGLDVLQGLTNEGLVQFCAALLGRKGNAFGRLIGSFLGSFVGARALLAPDPMATGELQVTLTYNEAGILEAVSYR